MWRQIVARVLQSLTVVLIVTTVSFFIIRAAPGDPFSYEGGRVTPEIQEHWRRTFGYDQPLPVQFAKYIGAVARGELGFSISRKLPVSTVLAEAFPRTLLLAGTALVLTLGLGIVIGGLQAAKPRGWFDRASSSVLVFFYSLPDFWAALMILLIFGFWWHVFPTSGMFNTTTYPYMTAPEAFGDRVSHLILPVATLTLLSLAAVARHQRAAMLEILPSDYVRTARAKGVPERQVLWRHALRTALTPIVAMFGLMLPAFLGGAVFIEKVFGWPGMGSLAADAISRRDYDVVTAIVTIGSMTVVIGNLIADVLQMALDPRVRE